MSILSDLGKAALTATEQNIIKDILPAVQHLLTALANSTGPAQRAAAITAFNLEIVVDVANLENDEIKSLAGLVNDAVSKAFAPVTPAPAAA